MRQSMLIGAVTSIMAISANAAELGDLVVRSHMNEPLSLELDVAGVNPNDQIAIKTAGPDVYRKHKRLLPTEALGLKVDVISRSPYRVRITGRNSVAAGSFPLILQAQHNGETTYKLYTIRLTNQKPTATTPKVATTAQTSKPAVKSVAQPSEPKKTAKDSEPTQPKKPNAVIKSLTVQKGDSIWALAKRVQAQYPDAMLDQLIVAIARKNPKCFGNGRLGNLKLGCRLNLPSKITVSAIPEDVAVALVRVKPKSNVLKEPSAQTIRAARKRLAKTDPVWAKRLEQDIKREKERARKAKEEAAKTAQAQAAQKQAQQQAPKPVEPQKALPVNAQTTQPSAVEPNVVPAPSMAPALKSEPTQAPVEAAANAQKTVTQPEKAPQPQVKATARDSGLGAWLWTLIVAMLAGVGAMVVWSMRRRQEPETTCCASQEHPVRFMTPAAGMTKEQEEGVETMLTNRLEADKAAERGFVLPKREQTQDVVEDATPVADEPKATVTEPIVTTEKAEPSLGALTDVTVIAHDEPKLGNFGDMHEAIVKAMDEKMEQAKGFVDMGAYSQAERALQEVMQRGNERQKQEALDLLKTFEQPKATPNA